jgi:perosamine synthetase
LNNAVAALAINGGAPVRAAPLPYGRQWIDDSDVAAVVAALRSDYLTTGPRVGELERAFASATGAREAVAVSTGTAALHAAVEALGVGPGDEVIVPTLTFAASANCVFYQGGVPVLADVAPDTLLLDPADVARRLTPRTKAIIAVDFGGQPCDYGALRALADRHRLALVADACHALGASRGGRKVGTLADVTAFSLHPVKHVTAGEGGVVTTDDPRLADRMRTFRHHGMTRPEGAYAWNYEVATLGQNYRLTDFQCALASSQLRRLDGWIRRRQELAAQYDRALARLPAIRPLAKRPEVNHAYHLYVVQLDLPRLRCDRDQFLLALRAEGILAMLHYPPVHLHPLYRRRLQTGPGQCPVAEAAAARIFSLPLFPMMSDADQADVVTALEKVLAAYGT